MKIIDDVARGQWLVERAGEWASVGGVAGAGFDAYARILHPFDVTREDLTVADEWGMHPVVETASWPWATVAERTGRVMHPLVQSRRLTNDETVWGFDDGWSLQQTREGWFDPALLAALTRHLQTTTPDDVVIGIWEGWGFPGQIQAYSTVSSGGDDDESARWEAESRQRQQESAAAISPEFRAAVEGGPHLEYPGREFVLLQSSLKALEDPGWGYGAGIGWTPHSPAPSPQLLWPEDHAWVVASEIDWDSTIVAGTRSVIDAILADPDFESFEVREGDQLTWDADLINPDLTAS